jgi:hypothetical protein
MKPMQKTITAVFAALTILIAVPLASANAPTTTGAPLAVRAMRLAVEVRAEQECLKGAQRRMEQRHRRWEDEARVSGAMSDAHFTLQLEHEQVLDQHRALLERYEWLRVREGELRRAVRRGATDENELARLASEMEQIEARHRALLEQHERMSLQHDEIIDARVTVAAR